MNPVAVAAKGKGGLNAARRARAIGARYGLTPRRMEDRLADVLEITDRLGCGATLPITVSAFERHPDVVDRFADLGIEFAVHGYYHVDHTSLADGEQLGHTHRARSRLQAAHVPATGFRAPYLRWNATTIDALRRSGFAYDSSQAMHWPIPPELENDAYRRALDFYASMPADRHPVLPWLEGDLVRIPYCLPDDEAVVDRLRLDSERAVVELWLGVFRAAHERGELLTLSVHPERIAYCAAAIHAVIDAARGSAQPVWIGRLDDIARWWRSRAASKITVDHAGDDRFHIRVEGPADLTVLVRNVASWSAEPWSDGYGRVREIEFDVRAPLRPVIGVHPGTPDALVAFLREQGYVVEVSSEEARYGTFVRRERFLPEDRLPLIAEVEAGVGPLVRTGRWPDGARSALALTGDVDALTLWDYAYRFLGR